MKVSLGSLIRCIDCLRALYSSEPVTSIQTLVFNTVYRRDCAGVGIRGDRRRSAQATACSPQQARQT